ncbi:MAG: aminotransferase class I/II-fold pyridoxal phosphate-dependent enzyme, partial [Fusobacteriaceae bacterium]
MKKFIAEKHKDRKISMGEKIVATNFKGEIINLGLGDIDLHTPHYIITDALNDAHAGHTHYGNSQGDIELRKNISNYHDEDFENYNISPENILVTNGAAHGMYLVLHTILNSHD